MDPQSTQKLALSGKVIEKVAELTASLPSSLTASEIIAEVVAQTVRLSMFSQLIRLDLSNNALTSLEGVNQNVSLKWPSAQSNLITALTGYGQAAADE